MQWFTISHGKREGPFDTDQLLEMFQTNHINLDTLVVRDGSRIARRFFCAPEIFFEDIIAHGPNQRTAPRPGAGRSVTRIARLTRPSRDELKQASANSHQDSIAERHERGRRDESLTNHYDDKPEKKAGQKERANPRSQQRSLRSKRAGLGPDKRGGGARSDKSPIPRPSGPAVDPGQESLLGPQGSAGLRAPVLSLQSPSLKSGQKEPGPELKNMQPPAHQLPKAASEAQFTPRDNFGWAKNRVNPTALSSAMLPRERVPAARRGRKLPGRARSAMGIPPEVKLLFVGLVTIITLLFIINLIINRPPPPRQPRFSQSRGTEVDPGNQRNKAAITFSEAEPIVIRPSNPKSKNREVRDTTRAVTARRTTQAKEEAPPEKRVQSPPPKKIAKQDRKTDSKTKNLRARRPDSTKIPPYWPNTKIQGSEDLARHVFKQVSIESIRLVQIPKACSPCQIPGVLRDGTRIVLTSQNLGPWKAVQRSGDLNIKVTGLLRRSDQGPYSIIVKEVAP